MLGLPRKFSRSLGNRYRKIKSHESVRRPIYKPGTYVGPAVFRPARLRDLRDDLRHAVGKVVELEFVTVAGADERWAGQNIYMEVPGTGGVLHGAWVVDEDVQFFEPSRGRIEHVDAVPSPEVQEPLQTTAAEAPLVLLVDDSRDTRELYGFVLNQAGYQVIDADDGLSALEIARRTRPDAIVMDINLPEMSGVDVIKLLRAEPETARTPILAFTAYAESAAEALRTGADAQCLKPCLPEDFLESLRLILPTAGEGLHAR